MFRSPIIDAALVLIVVLLFVGPKKLPQLGRGLGEGMREFKDGITGDKKHEDEPTPSVTLTQANAMPTAGTADERPPQPAAAPGRDAGSEPRA